MELISAWCDDYHMNLLRCPACDLLTIYLSVQRVNTALGLSPMTPPPLPSQPGIGARQTGQLDSVMKRGTYMRHPGTGCQSGDRNRSEIIFSPQ